VRQKSLLLLLLLPWVLLAWSQFKVGYKEMIIIHEELELFKLFALCCNEQQ
jgi:hypothetical protein